MTNNAQTRREYLQQTTGVLGGLAASTELVPSASGSDEDSLRIGPNDLPQVWTDTPDPERVVYDSAEYPEAELEFDWKRYVAIQNGSTGAGNNQEYIIDIVFESAVTHVGQPPAELPAPVMAGHRQTLSFDGADSDYYQFVGPEFSIPTTDIPVADSRIAYLSDSLEATSATINGYERRVGPGTTSISWDVFGYARTLTFRRFSVVPGSSTTPSFEISFATIPNVRDDILWELDHWRGTSPTFQLQGTLL